MSTLSDYGIMDFNSPGYRKYSFAAIDHVVCCDAVKVLRGIDPEDPDDEEIRDRKIKYIRDHVLVFPMNKTVTIIEWANQVSDWKPEVITTSRFKHKPPRSPSDVLNLEARLTYTESDICFVICLHNLAENKKIHMLSDSVPHPFLVLVALDACMFAITEKFNEFK